MERDVEIPRHLTDSGKEDTPVEKEKHDGDCCISSCCSDSCSPDEATYEDYMVAAEASDHIADKMAEQIADKDDLTDEETL